MENKDRFNDDVPATHGWFALWTRCRHEPLVCRELESRGVEVFLPTVPRWSTWKDRRRKIYWPLFPGYCFARFNPSAKFSVLNCTGVAGIVSVSGTPATVSDDEIDAVRRIVASSLEFDAYPNIPTGTRVEIIRGPLKGVVGRLTRVGSRTSFLVTVELINRSVSVQIEAADISPV